MFNIYWILSKIFFTYFLCFQKPVINLFFFINQKLYFIYTKKNKSEKKCTSSCTIDFNLEKQWDTLLLSYKLSMINNLKLVIQELKKIYLATRGKTKVLEYKENYKCIL